MKKLLYHSLLLIFAFLPNLSKGQELTKTYLSLEEKKSVKTLLENSNKSIDAESFEDEMKKTDGIVEINNVTLNEGSVLLEKNNNIVEIKNCEFSGNITMRIEVANEISLKNSIINPKDGIVILNPTGKIYQESNHISNTPLQAYLISEKNDGLFSITFNKYFNNHYLGYIYDNAGRFIESIKISYNSNFDYSKLASGIYNIVINENDYKKTLRFIIIK